MDERSRFIERTADERRERQKEKERENAVVKIQAIVRGWLSRRRYTNRVFGDIASSLSEFSDLEKNGKQLLSNERIIELGIPLLHLIKFPDNLEALCQLCRHLIISLDSSSKDSNFAAVFLNKSTIPSGNRLIGGIMRIIPLAMDNIKGSKVSEVRQWNTLIHWIVMFSSANTWSLVKNAAQVQQVLTALCVKMAAPLYEIENYERLCNSLFLAVNETRPLLSVEAVNALFSILFRPIRTANSTPPAIMTSFVKNVLTAPAITLHLATVSCDLLLSSNVLARSLSELRQNPSILEKLDPARALNLMGNIIHLGYLEHVALVENLLDWTWTLGELMKICERATVLKGEKSSHNHWHPVFGNYRVRIDAGTEGSLRHVLRQLQNLWGRRVVNCLFGKVLPSSDPNTNSKSSKKVADASNELAHSIQKLWKKLGSSIFLGESQNLCDDLTKQPLSMTALVCQLYISALNSFTNLKTEILSGLCREDALLSQLWSYLTKWGPSSNGDHPPLTQALTLAMQDPILAAPHLAPLHLFADSAASVISILDDEEIYELGTPFSVQQLAAIAKFCNIFCYRAVWNGVVDENKTDLSLFNSIHHLNSILYTRDCRRSFTNDAKFWLAPDIKSSILTNEFEKKTERGVFLMRRMSHLVTLKERMVLFRRYVQADKASIDIPPTLITVVRNRLVEDGYRQLSLLSSRSLRATIRVKFVNQQGLDEAGIDQDGVFKEFLELTIKQVFNPSLNLFKPSESGQLYPSPTSSVHEEHLELFQFVGRMLAKAVYEGIVVDVQLTPVLLATVLGGRRLCAFDELSQLDPELYKNLTYVKRYSDSDDVSDLALTFSIDNDFMGKISTVDLLPGGRTIQVTNENKIDYVHRMAHYRVFTQTRQQCKAFVHGFQSVMNPAWLFLFAPHELQYLISGTASDIDLSDLRKHVQYYGGFHSNHRLIKWLWQILESEFSRDERRLFLKFVTSCSRGPLLGFAYLEPPFSIRCVEVSDDQDQGDTLASVVRGFLAIKKKEAPSRLPTASTCFNLLKLPNYSKKSTLLQKLRYAIHSETGFELS